MYTTVKYCFYIASGLPLLVGIVLLLVGDTPLLVGDVPDPLLAGDAPLLVGDVRIGY